MQYLFHRSPLAISAHSSSVKVSKAIGKRIFSSLKIISITLFTASSAFSKVYFDFEHSLKACCLSLLYLP